MNQAPMMEISELRPSHETIVEMILVATNEELVFLASYLKRTFIPDNHDQIIAAWNQRRKQMCWHEEDLGVPTNLLLQKQVVEAKTVRQNHQPGIDLGELQKAMETFLAISHNGGMASMVSWHVRLRERMENLHRLLSRALGK